MKQKIEHLINNKLYTKNFSGKLNREAGHRRYQYKAVGDLEDYGTDFCTLRLSLLLRSIPQLLVALHGRHDEKRKQTRTNGKRF